MAGLAVKLTTLIVVLVSVYLDMCQACGVCDNPIYKPPTKPIKPAPLTPTPKPPTLPKPPAPAVRPITPPVAPPTCPVSLLQLSVCSPLLGGIVGGLLPSSNACCALLNVLGLDVELCLCLAIDANVLGLITINAKVDAVASILTSCGYKVPPNLSCPH